MIKIYTVSDMKCCCGSCDLFQFFIQSNFSLWALKASQNDKWLLNSMRLDSNERSISQLRAPIAFSFSGYMLLCWNEIDMGSSCPSTHFLLMEGPGVVRSFLRSFLLSLLATIGQLCQSAEFLGSGGSFYCRQLLYVGYRKTARRLEIDFRISFQIIQNTMDSKDFAT